MGQDKPKPCCETTQKPAETWPPVVVASPVSVRTLHGQLPQAMVILDVYTRELLGLRAYDGWDVDSTWTMRTLAAAFSESKCLAVCSPSPPLPFQKSNNT
jgi:hypothetical protein